MFHSEHIGTKFYHQSERNRSIISRIVSHDSIKSRTDSILNSVHNIFKNRIIISQNNLNCFDLPSDHSITWAKILGHYRMKRNMTGTSMGSPKSYKMVLEVLQGIENVGDLSYLYQNLLRTLILNLRRQ